MIMEILSSSIQAGLRDLNLSAAISAPVLIGEDRIGLIIYQEGRIPLFWDSPIAEMNERMAIIPSLLEMQPEIVGSNGVHDASLTLSSYLPSHHAQHISSESIDRVVFGWRLIAGPIHELFSDFR